MRLLDSGMKKLSAMACALLLVGTLLHGQSSTSASKSAQKPTSEHKASGKSKKARKSRSRKRGQQKIDSQRARQIQEALVREHYLSGNPSGAWDGATQKAMQKYQADNGWQSKTTPDSRALIKLGLGPGQEHLLNPESAMTQPPATHSVQVSTPTASDDPEKSQR